MDAEIEPSNFDLVVVGTGLPESILAGAAAQAGKTVLHLDPAESYGSQWATLQLDSFLNWAKAGGAVAHLGGSSAQTGENIVQTASSSPSEPEAPAQETIPLSASASLYSDFAGHSEDSAGPSSNCALPPGVGSFRSYGVDLAGPRLALAAGPLIELLIQCGAHNYLEFKAVEGSYTWHEGHLEPVPSSRADVFRSRSLSLVEKRHLTKFFKLVTESSAVAGSSGEGTGSDAPEEDLSMPFVDFLTKHKLPPFIRQSILYSIALLDRDQEGSATSRVSAREGMRALTTYLQSVGRFGPGVGAFLYPLYGAGELPQAFCRIAAVKGALYVLRRGICALLLDKASRRLQGVVTSTGQHIHTSKLVIAPGLFEPVHTAQSGTTFADCRTAESRSAGGQSSGASESWASANGDAVPLEEPCVCRCVCVTDAPLTPGQSNVLVVFAPRSLSGATPSNPVRAFQAGESISICPHGRFLVQMSMLGSEARSAKDDLQPVVEALFETRGEMGNEGGEKGGAGNRAPGNVPAGGAPPAEQAGVSAGSEGEGIPEPILGSSDGEPLPLQSTEATPSGTESKSTDRGNGFRQGEDAVLPSASRLDGLGSSDMARASDGTSASEASEPRKPRVLWSVYFKQRTVAPQKLLEGDVYTCSSPDGGLTYEQATREVDVAFKRLYPDLPYFPPQAPGPEETVENEENDDGHRETV